MALSLASRFLLPLTLLASAVLSGAATAQEEESASLRTFVKAQEAHFFSFYQDLHRNPELSFQEEKTAAKMAKVLQEAGYEVTTGIGGHGLIGVLKNGEGKTVLVRADMDALPLQEKTGLAYSSQATGLSDDGAEVPVMHACGHDMHMAVWAGVATYFATHQEEWKGTVIFLAQPAEERGAGARAMIEEDLFTLFPEPDACFALHVKGELPAGTIGLCSGYALGNVDSVDILVHGQGGHGSTPHKTHDPVVLAARIVVGLQTIVSRRVPPVEDGVVTVGSIHGGLKHNIIPDEVKMQLTVRSYKPEIRELLIRGIEETALGEAIAAGFPKELMPTVILHEDEFTPATYNTPELVQAMEDRYHKIFGADHVVDVPAVMGGEDFGRYGPAVGCPSVIFWLGTASAAAVQAAQEEGGPALASTHQSHFAPDPLPTWRTGVRAMSAAMLLYLGE
jgi:amidohydrolase